MMKLPFAFDRNSEVGLAEQLADGFARAIRDGLYNDGDVLPSIRALAASLNVGEMTVRGALKRLVAARLVNPRRGIGSVVVGAHGALARGRVLLVSMSRAGNYCHTMIRSVLREELLRAGYLPIEIEVMPQAADASRFSQLDQLLGESVALTVVFGTSGGVWEYLDARGENYVVLGDAGRQHVPLSLFAALPGFVADCRRAGVRRVIVPFVSHSPVGADVARSLNEAGVPAKVWQMRVVRGGSSRERMFRTAFAAFSARLKRGRDWLPDVFFFPDDEMAAAALYALDCGGVRIPEDVGFVCWHACGSAPFYWKRLTCLETDPVAAGQLFARGVLRVLSGRPLPARISLRSTYVRGETFG